MATAADQQALSKSSQVNPDLPTDEFSDEAIAPSKTHNLRLGFLKLEGLQHNLKLRSRQQLRKNLFAELGADLNASKMAILPRASLEYKVENGAGRTFMTLRADRRALYVQKSFPVNIYGKVTGRIQTTVASTYEGVPEIHLGLDRLRPQWLMAVGAIALLASNKPVSGGRTFGRTNIQLPLLHKDSVAQGEGNVTLSRNGNGLMLGLNQLNAFLRI